MTDKKFSLSDIRTYLQLMDDLNHIYNNLLDIEELLKEYLYNSPSQSLFCIYDDIVLINEKLLYFKEKKMF